MELALRNDTLTRTPALSLEDLVRVFGRGGGEVHALDGVSLQLSPGSFTAIMGPSGSGTSTLLQLAAGLDRPTAGQVHLGELDLNELSERRLSVSGASASASSFNPSTCSAH
jgi:putative ABC transport system ATP-binding protein